MYPDVAKRFEIQGYPNIRLFTKEDKDGDLEFNGHRSEFAIVQFITNKGHEPRDPQSLILPLTRASFNTVVLAGHSNVLVCLNSPGGTRPPSAPLLPLSC